MKTITKELQIDNIEISRRGHDHMENWCGMRQESGFNYSFDSHKLIDFNTMKITYEEQEPETLKEFKEENNLSSKQLTEWLNKNYK